MIGFSSSQEVFRSFEPYIDLERGAAKEELKLDRMRALAACAGDPQGRSPGEGPEFIHVAGSKGKGSVCAMIASILSEAGIKTGLYSSPHVTGYAERISLAGEPFPESAYLEAGEAVHEALAAFAKKYPQDRPTFFELLTLLAFIVFRRQGCRAVVLETGLGGRLDSTNIVLPKASVIQPIELEHVEYLGGTIPLIAGEKAGIIKPGVPVFISPMRPEARSVMEARALELGSPLYDSEKLSVIRSCALGVDGTECAFSIEAPGGRMDFELSLAMIGRVQARNAALAALTVSRVYPAIDKATIARGLEKARLLARFEVLSKDPLRVVDGSHTPDSVAAALDSWKALGGGGTLLFGCASDKDMEGMAKILAGEFESLIITAPGSFKKADPLKAFNAFAPLGHSVILEPDTCAALRMALDRGRLLVTGSFYLAAAARRLILG
jgi:dihydrofolate synthase / folylpolyglutamate synthase